MQDGCCANDNPIAVLKIFVATGSSHKMIGPVFVADEMRLERASDMVRVNKRE